MSFYEHEELPPIFDPNSMVNLKVKQASAAAAKLIKSYIDGYDQFWQTPRTHRDDALSMVDLQATIDADPVDDIPVFSLSDFLCFFVDYLTKHRAIRKNLFLTYDETNQAQVIQPCLLNAIRKSLPHNVERKLLEAQLAYAKSLRRRRHHHPSHQQSTRGGVMGSRRKPPLVKASSQFDSHMMSSRAQLSKMNTTSLHSTMLVSNASSVALPQDSRHSTLQSEVDGNKTKTKKKERSVVEEREKQISNPQEEEKVKGEVEPLGLSTKVEPTALKLGNTEGDGNDDVRQVNLDSMKSESRQPQPKLNVGRLANVAQFQHDSEIATSVPVYRQ